MHKHLRRLERVWIDDPIFFITACTFRRKPILTQTAVADVLIDEWNCAQVRHGWGNWFVRDHAGSCSFLLRSRTRSQDSVGLYARMEIVDESQDSCAKAAAGDRGYDVVATRVL